MPSPEFYAQRVLDRLRIHSVSDLQRLDEIAWARGALVTDKPLDGSEARIVITRGRAIITVSTRIDDPHRRRFSIAHELGHFEMHRKQADFTMCAGADLDDWQARQSGKSREYEANAFAGALLLPRQLFEPRCQEQPSLEHISALAVEFAVSLTATARRFAEFSPEPCAIVFSRAGYIRWFHESKEFREMGLFVDVKSKLDPSTMAALYFAGQSIPSRAVRVDADAWLRPGRHHDQAPIREQSFAMPTYNAVLTLLWVEDDMEEDLDDYEDN